MRIQTVVVLLVLGGVGMDSGCRNVAPAPARAGSSRFQIQEAAPLPDPDTTIVRSVWSLPLNTPATLTNPATPIEPLAPAVYPQRALQGRAGFALVGVRITIDEAGRVSDVADSLVCPSMPGPFADDFRAAVDAAVSQWRFHPAEVSEIERIQNPDRSFEIRVNRTEKAASLADVTFTFNDTGIVVPQFVAGQR